jgi:hypothetical protein
MDLKRVADHIRFSIGQVMVATAIIALALAPVGGTLRNPKKEWIVATVAYEVIFLPAVILLILGVGVKPGRARNRGIAVFCLLPIAVIALVGFSAALPKTFRELQNFFATGAYKELPSALAHHPQVLIWFLPGLISIAVQRISNPRCPSCRSRRLRGAFRAWDGKPPRPPVTFHCEDCGARYERAPNWYGGGELTPTPGPGQDQPPT